jgi:hypothetical protein
LRLSGAGLAGVALFVASACERTESETDVKTYGVDSVAELKAVTPVADQRVTALGDHSPGDGGGGLFYYVGKRSLPENGGTVIYSDADVGQWLRVFEGPINVRWFGARGMERRTTGPPSRWPSTPRPWATRCTPLLAATPSLAPWSRRR